MLSIKYAKNIRASSIFDLHYQGITKYCDHETDTKRQQRGRLYSHQIATEVAVATKATNTSKCIHRQ